jgi:hypothetical protein
MRNDQDAADYAEHPPVRRCGHCGTPLVSQRKRARYCDRRCKELAREARKRAGGRLTTLRQRHPLTDATLVQLHERARPPREFAAGDDFEVPADVEPDEFGYTDGLLDDEPGTAWTVRQEMERETEAVRARYAAEIKRWTAVYARNPGPAPKLTEIMRKMNAEIREIERRHYLQEAHELALEDQRSGRAQVRAQERHKELVNMQDFGRDLRGARYEPVQVSKATEDVFTFGGRPGSVFGTDNEVYRKSQVAHRMYNANPYSGDGFRF